MVARGEWRRPHRGVFIDNAAPVTALQPVVAAYFALRGIALGSHRVSLWLWGLVQQLVVPLEFCVPAGRSARITGVKVYRINRMPPGFRKGVVWTTSPMRALLDTAAVAPDEVSEPLLNGLIIKRFTPKAVAAEIERARTQGKRGVTALSKALKDLGVGRYTPSQLEMKARRLFRELGLPEPQCEVVFGNDGEYRLDFYWPEADLVIEVDGWSIHADPDARRRDFSKQNRIVIGNHWVLRYDWFQVVHRQEQTGAEVLEAYRARTTLPLA